MFALTPALSNDNEDEKLEDKANLNQEDSLKTSNSKIIIFQENGLILDETSFKVEPEIAVVSNDDNEVVKEEDAESVVSFNVFYYLLEKFKFSNSTVTE